MASRKKGGQHSPPNNTLAPSGPASPFLTAPGLGSLAGPGSLSAQSTPSLTEQEEFTQSIEEFGKAEVDEVWELRQAADADKHRFTGAVDSEYFCCLVFESRDQKETFLRALGWIVEFGDKYIDGVKLAAELKIPLPPANLRFIKSKPDKTLDSLSLPLAD